ncbi:MAG: class I fructose-bisphosphate aldolase [bacterium]
MKISEIKNLIGPENQDLLTFKSKTFEKDLLTFPSPDFVDQVFVKSDRNNQVLRNLQNIYNNGRLGKTGYLSIFPVDQGVEHSAGARFADNPIYFDPENIVKLGLESDCNAVVSTLGTLGLISRQYAHKIPFIVKLNHNEFLTYPNKFDEIMFADVEQAWKMGAVGVGATIYFGSPESNRQIVEVSKAFKKAHELGLITVLWCYLRNDAFVKDGVNYHYSADLTGQANYLGVTIEADIIKQKPAKNNGGYKAISSKDNPYGALSDKIYTELTTDHPIDLTRYQLANCYAGKIPLINSGDPSGENDLKEAVKAAIINKRAGGSGLIMGRKAFQKSFAEGVQIIQAVQDVYMCKEIDLA